MHFAEPRWLLLAFLGPLLLLALQVYSSIARKRQLAQIASPTFLQQLTESHSPLRRGFKNLLLILALGGIGVALARPQWGEQRIKEQHLGEDVVFILDCSRSMLATDISPSRIGRARQAVLDYIHNPGVGRVGLVAFAGTAFLQCPLTFDYNAFEEALLAVDDKTIPILGTDIGIALEEGMLALDKNNPRKILVLITDGEDLEKGGVAEAQQLAKKGVVVFTLGVGTPAGEQIQIRNERGQVELLRDEKGEVVRSHLDETTLRTIAETTHGSYYPLGLLGEGLVKVRLAIQNLSTRAGSVPGYRLGVDRFHWFIAAAILLLVAESLIGTRRRFRLSSAARK
jgi:Ca-activated chloride channel family protein